MGTRCNIIVQDEYDRIQLYRHWDGYPESILVDLDEALQYAWELPRFESGDFAAAIVRAWKEKGGGNVYIDGSPVGWELLHGDIEWLYVITKIEKEREVVVVAVYEWGWGSNPEEDLGKPVLTVDLTKAKEAGENWKNS